MMGFDQIFADTETGAEILKDIGMQTKFTWGFSVLLVVTLVSLQCTRITETGHNWKKTFSFLSLRDDVTFAEKAADLYSSYV